MLNTHIKILEMILQEKPVCNSRTMQHILSGTMTPIDYCKQHCPVDKKLRREGKTCISDRNLRYETATKLLKEYTTIHKEPEGLFPAIF